jgi:hypothetical protein
MHWPGREWELNGSERIGLLEWRSKAWSRQGRDRNTYERLSEARQGEEWIGLSDWNALGRDRQGMAGMGMDRIGLSHCIGWAWEVI